MSEFDLRGKDWLSEAQAAHYCGVSLTQFRRNHAQFKVRRFMGKRIYSRAELFDAIERAEPWLRSTREEPSTISTGERTASGGGGLSERLRPVRLKKYVARNHRVAP